MITFGEIKAYKEPDKTGLYIRGHADYAKGDDIVCAAVSAIGQTAAKGCKCYDRKTEIRQHKKGHIVFVCYKTAESIAIINAALLGLNAIKLQYPQCFTKDCMTDTRKVDE